MTEDATIILTTPRPWFGSQQLGAFVVSLDGNRVGALMPQGSLQVGCPPGRHRVRARQWFYGSPTVEIELAGGQVARLTVDVVRRGSLLTRMLRLMFFPWRAVCITAAGG